MTAGPVSYRLWFRWIAPLVFFQLYLAGTVLLFFAGPWPWPVRQPWLLGAFLAAAQLSMAVGFLLAWKPAPNVARVDGSRGSGLLVAIATIVTLLIFVPTSLSRTGSWLPDVVRGFSDTGAAYNTNFRRLQEGNPWLVVEYVRMILSPILAGLLLWAVAYWGRLSRPVRFLAVAAILSNLAIYVATGTNKGIADTLVLLPWVAVLAAWHRTISFRIPRPVLIVAGLLAFALFLDFFGRGQLQREGGVGELGLLNTGTELIEADRLNAVSAMLPHQLVIIYESLTRYLGQGYYALSMSFGLEWSSTLGVGHSMFLARNADAIFRTDAFTHGSLPAVLESQTGWDMESLWHSIYPWIASDVGFAGCLIVMALLGWLLGAAWLDSLTVFHPAAVALVGYLLIVSYYVPANNQVMQSGESAVGFLLTLGWWAASRRAWLAPADDAGSVGPTADGEGSRPRPKLDSSFRCEI